MTGLYFYDGGASEITWGLKPSPRGELEIIDLSRRNLEAGKLAVETMGRGFLGWTPVRRARFSKPPRSCTYLSCSRALGSLRRRRSRCTRVSSTGPRGASWGDA